MRYFFTDIARTPKPKEPPQYEVEPGGVGAESWVNGRQNSTGYRIRAGDELLLAKRFELGGSMSGWNPSNEAQENWRPPPASQTPVRVGIDDQPQRTNSNLPDESMSKQLHRESLLSSKDSTAPTEPAAWAGSVSGGRENAGVTSVHGSNYGPSEGGAAPPGMMQTLVGRFELQGDRFVYTPETTPNGYMIYRTDMQRTATVPQQVASYPLSKDFNYFTDQTTTHVRVWKVASEGRRPRAVLRGFLGRLRPALVRQLIRRD